MSLERVVNWSEYHESGRPSQWERLAVITASWIRIVKQIFTQYSSLSLSSKLGRKNTGLICIQEQTRASSNASHIYILRWFEFLAPVVLLLCWWNNVGRINLFNLKVRLNRAYSYLFSPHMLFFWINKTEKEKLCNNYVRLLNLGYYGSWIWTRTLIVLSDSLVL
jgi:hypothetical protein